MNADMLKRTGLSFLAGTICLAAMGCGSGSPKDASDWTYNPPEGLKQQDKDRNGATVFLGPNENGFTTNLQVRSGQTKDQSAQQIGQEDLDKLKAEPGVTIKEQEAYTIPDSDAYTWLISKKTKSGIVAEQRQFVVTKNKIAVLFTLTSSETSMSKWDQDLADSLKSFKWGRS